MSHNQSRFEKTEGHLKRPGRSGSLGKSKGFSSGGKGGGPPATAPAHSSSSALPPSSASLESSNNRSVKKVSRAVKITHPVTHEELKLDKITNLQTDAGTSGQRQIPNTTSQSQPLPTFNQQISYNPETYNQSPMFSPSSLPLSSNQMTTGPQASRYGYPVGQNGHTIPFMNPSPINSAMGGRPGLPPALHGLPEAVNSEVSSVSASLAATAQVIIKPAILSASEKIVRPSVRISMPITKPESPKQYKLF